MIPSFVGILLLVSNSHERYLLAMKPVVVEVTDTPVQRLQKERFNERLCGYQNWNRSMHQLHCREPPLLQGLRMLSPLVEAGASLSDKSEAKLVWAEIRVAIHWNMERYTKIRVGLGAESPQTLNLAKAARIDAEIELLRLKEVLTAKQ